MNSTLGKETRDAVAACRRCEEVCLETALLRCLELGGEHVGPAHFRLMLNCADICATCANFMLGDSPLHGRVCAVCAEVCERCEQSCSALGQMDECVDACRQCAQSCRSMAAMATATEAGS